MSIALPMSLSTLPFTRIRVPARGWAYHAGQPHPGLYFVQAGFLKTVIGSEDGRERICAFPMRGEWLGLESIGRQCHVADCTALDASEVWHFPQSVLDDAGVATCIAGLCAEQLREQQAWALSIQSLCAERRVVAFLEDLGGRHARLGCSAERFRLRMTRSEMGNFLGLKIETVTRALTRLQANGALRIDRREVTLPSDTAPMQRPTARDRTASAGLRMQSVPHPVHARALM